MHVLALVTGLVGVANAACPYMTGEAANPHIQRRADGDAAANTEEFLFPILPQRPRRLPDLRRRLSAGERGATLLEDFIFRQKIQRFDHERVPERAVHARGAGAHGTFTSYGDWSNLTAASFLSAEGKQTPMFTRFSTVAGSRGSADTARDVHGFATRFYTDEGNFDIVGNNVPVFFIQDAILFPDLIHAVKPRGDNEIPQAATAHDSAWDFFSQQPSTLHTLLWAMAGHGIPRSFRHVDGFGVHTFRLVTDDGKTKLVKFHWKGLQGKASFVWEEAQQTAGKNADFMRQDLFESIEAGRFPEWELGVQIMEEEDQLRFGFDLLDPTKIVPEELVPVTILGKMQLNRNPMNYFAETEQVMFQPGHIVRGVDFTEDPLLQGRLFSYLDTQLNRHGGPNFEQLPINRPRAPIHNNNRDGAANQTVGKGFFTAPERTASGKLQRTLSTTFEDNWSQPRLFWNSLVDAEKQFIVDAMRFETSNVKSSVVRNNVIIQLNRISNDLATRVAKAIGVEAPKPDSSFYHDNTTAHIGAFGQKLAKLDGLKVGLLASVDKPASIAQGAKLQSALSSAGVDVVVVAERMADDVDQTYSASDAVQFDAVVVADGAEGLFGAKSFTSQPTKGSGASTLYPAGRPLDILLDAFRFGKTVGALGKGSDALQSGQISSEREGVYTGKDAGDAFAKDIKEGLSTFKFLDRFAVDQ
ncbi:hypothetical protein N7519_001066 [Penicillium mononematosum]|uniref:uncharacterized protein n=1 Tax=Penicillium mononematosum TaxID=268346 RepID=UPI00254663FA|nr:uncharacterized protein N7519_001066 [Penicillium mononematosum]KAJ6191045.1 hypothetical protein N7519_001066 [Penicillium mononematosum]